MAWGDFNQVILTGRLTRDPELRSTPSGQSVASLSIASNRSRIGQDGEKIDEVQYFDIVVWAKQAEFVGQYLSKGRKIMVAGRLQNRSWEAQDGTKRYKTEVIAQEINFMDSKGASGETDKTEQETKVEKPKKEEESEEEINIDDIPF